MIRNPQQLRIRISDCGAFGSGFLRHDGKAEPAQRLAIACQKRVASLARRAEFDRATRPFGWEHCQGAPRDIVNRDTAVPAKYGELRICDEESPRHNSPITPFYARGELIHSDWNAKKEAIASHADEFFPSRVDVVYGNEDGRLFRGGDRAKRRDLTHFLRERLLAIG